ncbi:unnamed protein product [Adineta steineri]|uniref:Uncharacterized protein n=1 Tax=Adineta steineri TaxID=433720 RepID=A0A819DGK3_9BILA|nr:unnamed protein product [Adineta steineri]CAF3837009.1 unnamed protein product [Adineta steineri]
MKIYWSFGAVVCLSISGLLISTVVILSLIPVYTPSICQDNILNSLFTIENVAYTLNNITIPNLSESIHININENLNNLNILSLTLITGLGEVPLDIQHFLKLKSTRRRRQISSNNPDESLYKLIGQTLNLTNSGRYVPFTITNHTTTYSLDNSSLELHTSVILRYGVYCLSDCLIDKIGNLTTDLSNTSLTSTLSYQSLYNVELVKVLPPENYSAPSLRILSYEINSADNNISNTQLGAITDKASLTSISDAVNSSLNSSIDYEIEGASIVQESIDTKLFSLSQKQTFRYILVVIIKFIFQSSCDRHCQKEKLKVIIDDGHVPRPPPIIIRSVKFILPKPTIVIFEKPSSSAQATTTTTTITTAHTGTGETTVTAHTVTGETTTATGGTSETAHTGTGETTTVTGGTTATADTVTWETTITAYTATGETTTAYTATGEITTATGETTTATGETTTGTISTETITIS